MSNQVPLPCPRLLLDACCAITLHASGFLGDILAATAKQVAIAAYVLEQELLNIDVQSLIASGAVVEITLSGEVEEVAFVNLATNLDDGEAYTGAIALQRNWTVATDDLKAIRILSAHQPPIQVVTTPELVRHWANATGISPIVLRGALRAMQADACYHPPRSHHLAGWWEISAAG